MNNKFIALDIGNVCIAIDAIEDVLDRAGIHGEKNVILRKLEADHELGKTDEKTFLDKAESILDFKYGKDQIYSLFCKVLKNEIPGMSDIIELTVKKGYAIAFFSDTAYFYLREACSMLSFAHYVIGGVYSFETGVFKPDIKMLSAFEERYGRPVLYIDDKKNNCDGAIAHGWNAHCFTGVEGLKPVIDELKAAKRSINF